jgi:hypothetical protein
MADQKYAAGIIRGIKLNGGHLGLFYLLQPSPWPELPAVGAMRTGRFARCSGCKSAWSFVSYGGWPACLDCATRKAAKTS